MSLTISACGDGDSGSDAGSNATTIVTATAPWSGMYLVSWSPVADSRVTGYKLYYSTTSLDVGAAHTVDVGDATTYTFNPVAAGISAGSTVYFAVAAVSSGVESAMSTPASVVVQ